MTDDSVTTVPIGGPVCRRCVRRLSRRIADLPGVVALEVHADRGLVQVHGRVSPALLRAALCHGGYVCDHEPWPG